MKMIVSLSLLFTFSLFVHAAHGHDITQILNQYPDFSTFNSYLTQTNLAAQIDSRQTITVLVVDNGAISPLASISSPDTIKNILSVHVILDYYDASKLQQLPSSSTLLTTLFQSTGMAKGQQGFLQVTHPSAGSTVLGSAMPGSTQGSSLVKNVTAVPYNISVIQISSPIIPQGIDGSKTSSPPSMAPPTTTTPPPATAAAPTSNSTLAPKSSSPPTAPSSPPTTSSTPPTALSSPSSSPPTASSSPSSSPTASSSPPTVAAAPTNSVGVSRSATPGSAPNSGTSVDVPATEESTPATEDPAGAAPAGKKSAAAVVEVGLAVVCATALSSLYMTSRI